MKKRPAARLTAALCAPCAALTLILLTPFASPAQTVPQVTSPNSSTPTPNNAPDAGSRYPNSDMEVRAIELEREHAARNRDPNAILNEVNEDLHRLQTLGEEVGHAASGPQQPDFKYVLDSTAEIKKRALRLKVDLALPAGAKEERRDDLKETGNGPLQPGLAVLCKLLDGFLHNPIFSNADVGALDPHLTARARRDLDDIVTLSDKLHKTAEKLSKSAGK
jgi:hypothetical protein